MFKYIKANRLFQWKCKGVPSCASWCAACTCVLMQRARVCTGGVWRANLHTQTDTHTTVKINSGTLHSETSFKCRGCHILRGGGVTGILVKMITHRKSPWTFATRPRKKCLLPLYPPPPPPPPLFRRSTGGEDFVRKFWIGRNVIYNLYFVYFFIFFLLFFYAFPPIDGKSHPFLGNFR